MEKAKGFKANCTGCAACLSVCPAGAVEIKQNGYGFFSAADNTTCIACGLCGQVCQHNEDKPEYMDLNACQQYAVRLFDKSEHRDCASGGAVFGLYQTAVKFGYKIAGVYYDTETHTAKMGIATTSDEAQRFKGSKYLQADCSDTVKQMIKSKEKYIIGASPCQILGIKRAAEVTKSLDRFIFVDLLCHGVPTYLVWNKYLKENIKEEHIKSISFRDHEHGWHRNFITARTNTTIYSSGRPKDDFYRLFDDSYVMNDACNSCRIAQRYSVADFRCGDLWDEKICKQQYYSRLFILSDRGKILWESAKSLFEHQIIIRPVADANANRRESNKVRKAAFASLMSDDTLSETLKKYHKSFSLRLKITRFLSKKMPGLIRIRRRIQKNEK